MNHINEAQVPQKRFYSDRLIILHTWKKWFLYVNFIVKICVIVCRIVKMKRDLYNICVRLRRTRIGTKCFKWITTTSEVIGFLSLSEGLSLLCQFFESVAQWYLIQLQNANYNLENTLFWYHNCKTEIKERNCSTNRKYDLR